jgi:hypothetical protein
MLHVVTLAWVNATPALIKRLWQLRTRGLPLHACGYLPVSSACGFQKVATQCTKGNSRLRVQASASCGKVWKDNASCFADYACTHRLARVRATLRRAPSLQNSLLLLVVVVASTTTSFSAPWQQQQRQQGGNTAAHMSAQG